MPGATRAAITHAHGVHRMALESPAKEVRNSLDIVDVISEHVKLKQSGKSYLGFCPFHRERSPSFSVTTELKTFRCFGCGARGDVLDFLARIESKTVTEVVSERRAKMGKLDTWKSDKPTAAEQQARMLAVVEAARMLRDATRKFNVRGAAIAERTLSNALDTLDGKRRG